MSYNYLLASYLVLFLSSIILIYIKLYTLRKLKRSLGSFIFFLINVCVLFMYVLGSINITSITEPIYIINMQFLISFMVHRYIFFFVIIIGFYFLINYFKLIKFPNGYNTIGSPYLMEEIRIILHSWEDSLFGPIFYSILKSLTSSVRKRQLYICIHIGITQILPWTLLVLFINFVFFHGDLRYVIYFLPVTFILWIYRPLFYYIIWYIGKINIECKSLLVVKSKKPLELSTYDDLIFEFSSKAKQDNDLNLSNEFLYIMLELWVDLTIFDDLYYRYTKVINVFNIIRLSLHLMCWFQIYNYVYNFI